MHRSDLVVWFKDVDKEDIHLVGGKGANLGEMTRAKFPVPNGFIVTSNAYFQFIKENNLTTKINHLLKTANYERVESLMQISKHVKTYIRDGKVNDELAKKIFSFYSRLDSPLKDPLVAIRSSATAEDLPGASFAGQQETYLNVQGEANVLLKVKEAWASLFNARALFYRHEKHFDSFRVGIAVPVQRMVNSEKSGIMFTIDPVTNDKGLIIIEAVFGLGELIVQGDITPDHYEVSKKTHDIILKTVSLQSKLLKKVGYKNKEVVVSKKDREKQKISDKQIIQLASLGEKLEKHYYFPQDIEWAIVKNEVYIVQTRPITTIQQLKTQDSKQEKTTQLKTQDSEHRTVITTGSPASPGIASGHARVIKDAKEINKVLSKEVLVAPKTNPDYVPAMRKAVAIVTDTGGRTSHAAIVSRELGIPSVVGAMDATKKIKTGDLITVNGTKGEVYKGGFTSLQRLDEKPYIPYHKTATKIYVNLAEPELAQKIARYHVDGVGLLRAEFMIGQIGIHPKKMIRDGKKHIVVNKLEEQLEIFAKAFHPRPVVYRTTDFKTNEYRQLVGGDEFEPHEENPMLGYRGAFRYINDPEVFYLELEAIKRIRNEKNLKNLWVMIPFVRTVKELIEVKKMISQAGLYRSETFKIWMMVEIPANVVLLDKFIFVGIDGISIGSNDLTMLMLGTDRDNSEVAREFDEQNEAVVWALEHIIKTAHKHNITASICGQSVSTYPSLVEKLVSLGINSVSVSPDIVDQTRKLIYEAERKLIK